MHQVGETQGEPSGDVGTSVDMYLKIVDRAHSEVKEVRDVYKWLSVSLGIILSTGISVGSYLTHSSIREMRADMKADRAEMRANLKEEIEFMKSKATQDYLLLATNLRSSVEKKTQDVETAVNSRIDSEFNESNIQNLVKNKAQDRIDTIADSYIGKHIEKKITPQIAAVNSTVKAIEGNVKDLEEVVRFNAVLSAATNDDREAFELLQNWGKTLSPFSVRAANAVRAIISSKTATFQFLTWEDSGYPWKPDTNPSKLDLEGLRSIYFSERLPGLRIALMDYVSKRNDITNSKKLSFLQEVLQKDKSLDVSIHAVQLVNKISGQTHDPFRALLTLDWLSKHSNDIRQ